VVGGPVAVVLAYALFAAQVLADVVVAGGEPEEELLQRGESVRPVGLVEKTEDVALHRQRVVRA